MPQTIFLKKQTTLASQVAEFLLKDEGGDLSSARSHRFPRAHPNTCPSQAGRR
jgi:hypothetical protein